jgi:tetraether lipid synthase
MMCYLYRGGDKPVPISRLVDVRKHRNLVANSIVYTPERVRTLAEQYRALSSDCGCGPSGCGSGPLDDFVDKALQEKLSGEDVFRIMLIAFLDVHNFDVRRVMKCCIGHVLPSGHIIPFCAYNTLYRDSFVPLPPLVESGVQSKGRRTLAVVG